MYSYKIRPNYFDGVAKFGLIAPLVLSRFNGNPADFSNVFACPKRLAAYVLVGCSVGVLFNVMRASAGGADWKLKKTVAENEQAHAVAVTTRFLLWRNNTIKAYETDLQ